MSSPVCIQNWWSLNSAWKNHHGNWNTCLVGASWIVQPGTKLYHKLVRTIFLFRHWNALAFRWYLHCTLTLGVPARFRCNRHAPPPNADWRGQGITDWPAIQCFELNTKCYCQSCFGVLIWVSCCWDRELGQEPQSQLDRVLSIKLSPCSGSSASRWYESTWRFCSSRSWKNSCTETKQNHAQWTPVPVQSQVRTERTVITRVSDALFIPQNQLQNLSVSYFRVKFSEDFQSKDVPFFFKPKTGVRLMCG